MKKKVLFIIIMLIPFITFAEPAENLIKAWVREDTSTFEGTYVSDTSYIKYNNSFLKSIDKYTGEVNILNYKGGYHIFYNNKILVISDDKNGTYLTTYNQKLNEIGKKKLGNFSLEFCVLYNNNSKNEILISGQEETDIGFKRVIYFIDYQGNEINHDEIYTIIPTESYYNDSNGYHFYDANNNKYYISGYRLERDQVNSDGSFLIIKNSKIYKYSESLEIIGTLDIPEGKSPTIAKKGNKYYIATGTYITKDSTKVYIDINLYLVSENLVLLKSGFIKHTSETYAKGNESTDLGNKVHGIRINNNGMIIVYIWCYAGSSTSIPKYYNVTEELDKINTTTSGGSGFSPFYASSALDPNRYKPEEQIEEYDTIMEILEHDGYIEKVKPQSGGPYYNGKVKIDKVDNKYIVNLLSYKTETVVENNSTVNKRYTKLRLLYLDERYNEIFNKVVYDWTCEGEGSTSLFNNAISFSEEFDDYIVLTANNKSNKYLLVYNKEGNVVKNLSKEIDFDNYFVSNLLVNDRGFAVEIVFDTSSDGEDFYVTRNIYASSDDNIIVPEDAILHMMLYFSYPFEIKTEINGEGVIRTEYVTAFEGTLVKFIVEPKPGYVLGEIKVTDANGNVVIFTDYTFSMPSADVTIEATFIPINPNTKTFTLYLAIVLGGISLIALYLFSQRKKYLK